MEVKSETFTIPPEFNIIEFFNSAWGLDLSGSVQTVKLHFVPKLKRAICAARWHPTQILETLEDGSLNMTIRIKDNHDFIGWILSWGDMVEVLEPQSLREEIMRILESSRKRYGSKNNCKKI